MITKLTLTNWKRFGEPGLELPLRPLTFLLGATSVGNSSVFQAMVALSQSASRRTPFSQLMTDGALASVGHPSHILHRNATDRRITISVEFGDRASEKRGSVNVRFGSDGRAETMTLSDLDREPVSFRVVSSSLDGEVRDGLAIVNFSDLAALDCRPEFAPIVETAEMHVRELRIDGKRAGRFVEVDPKLDFEDPDHQVIAEWTSTSGQSYEPEPDDVRDARSRLAERATARAGALEAIQAEFAPTGEGYRRLTGWLDARLGPVIDLVEGLEWIGPVRLRGSGPRVLRSSWEEPVRRLGHDGRNLLDVLHTVPDVVKRINTWLRNFENEDLSYYQVTLHRVETLGAEYGEVRVAECREGQDPIFTLQIHDVGVGLSQLLPVLAALAVARVQGSGGLLLIEQPELHLHPRWQATLAHIFLDEVLRDQDEARAGNRTRASLQVVLETHSEHMILRMDALARAARYQGLDQIVMAAKMYAGQSDRTTKVTPVPLERFADDDAWPGGFFSERLRELLETPPELVL